MLQASAEIARRDEDIPETAIAIVGMSVRTAGARGLDAYWDLLRSGREAVETPGEDELLAAGVSPAMLRNPNYVRRCAPLEDMECFDAGLFGLSPRDAAIMDPQHRHFLECVWEAFENAGQVPQRFNGAIGVFAGSGHNAYMPYNLLTNPKLVRDVGLFLLRHTSNDKDFLTTRVSYLLNLTGPSINVQTACSTSLVSIHMAAQSLLSGECDMAVAGGTSIELPHRQGYLFEEGEILAPDGHCRPFDADSKGTVFGSGVAVVVLRRLADAIEAGDHIYALVRGSAINNDGAGKVGYLAPSVEGQAKVISEAIAMAEVDAATIGYVEAHGTGTPVGDPIEVAALTQAFGAGEGDGKRCVIGSVKANIGHTDTAAGAAGLIKVALSLHNRELPPTINFSAPNPDCLLEESPFVVQTQHTPWVGHGVPLRAGVSSLGVGGTNAHIVLEEAPLGIPSGPSRGIQILPVSAKSDAALAANLAAHADHFAANTQIALADAAFTLSTGRQHLTRRRFAVAGEAHEAAQALRQEAERTQPVAAAIADRPVAFLFCGAGAQHVDMARCLYQTEAAFRDQVDAGLSGMESLGLPDVRRWLFPTEQDRTRAQAEMERPSVALPALFIIQVALARFWMSLGVKPGAMIGHSSGEYAAAHIAGVINLKAGLQIVSARGRLFEKVEKGAMLSVPLPETELAPLLPDDLSIAVINAPRLCVVSGPSRSIEKLRDDLADREIEAQLVRISVAAHSPMLDPILPEFQALLETIDFRPPLIPFASNLTGDWVTDTEAASVEYWVRHLRQTVRFTDGLQRLFDNPEQVLLEVGPGRSMASLVRQQPERPRDQPVVSSLPHPDQPVTDERFFWSSLGELWSLGVEIDWDAYWQGQRRARLPLPTYQFDRERHWIERGSAVVADAEDEELERREDVRDWYSEPVWVRTPHSQGAIDEGCALIFEDEAGVGAAIAMRLREAGSKVVSVRPGGKFRREADDRFVIDPASVCHYVQLFDQLSQTGELPVQIYHCWCVTDRRARRSDTQSFLDKGFFSLIALVPQLARQTGGSPLKLAYVTNGAQRVCGEEPPAPAKSAAFGALPVIATEYPAICMQGIDVVLPPTGSDRLLGAIADENIGELAGDDAGKAPVCFRGGERWVLEHRPAGRNCPANGTHSAIRAGGTYLITGGLGAIGLTIARHLAERGANIALIARTPLPPRDQWADIIGSLSSPAGTVDRIRKVLAIEATGAKTEIIAADVANPRAMKRAVRAVRARLGPVTGVFHTAGALDDGLIETRSRADIEAVLRPKIAGTLALDEALAREVPEFILLFSSISAFAGLPGQADYAAANAFLDAYAESRRGDPNTRVLSIGWSQWREVGMAASLGGTATSRADAPELTNEGDQLDHPFLDRLQSIDPDFYVATGVLSPDTHWLLDEHRIAGIGAVIPGTGYLELARATHEMIDPGPCILSDVLFMAPFAVADGEKRELRVQLRRRMGADWRFVVLGRPAGTDEEWAEHASGAVRPLRTGEAVAPVEVAKVEARCPTITDGAAGKNHSLTFGPRWNNVQRTAMGRGEALIHLTLPELFEDDFSELALHPALLDLATAGAQSLIPGYQEGGDLLVPFAYRRIVMHAPLQSRIVSHVRYLGGDERGTATATFDITITDENGAVLAAIEGFTLMRARTGLHMADATNTANSPAASGAGEPSGGILPEQGLEVIEQLLSGPAHTHVITSPYPLAPMLAQMRAPRPVARQTATDLDGDSPADLPATPMERAIAELWEGLLGIAPIRRNDSFFDLGGHSLLAVQFVNRFRKKTGKTLPLAALLDTPTVANLARIADPDERPDGEDAEAAAPESQRDVVVIRPGGTLNPIFFIHDGLGETLLYRGLALRLDPERPVYGVEPLRAPGGGFAHTRIDEMAANYVERIRSVQPEGPYILAGLCAGGVIAFEMARQIQDEGGVVASVCIIDAADVAAAKRSFYLTGQRLRRTATLLRQGTSVSLLPALSRRAFNAVAWETSSRIRRLRDRRAVRLIENVNANATGAGSGAAPSIGFLQLYEVAHREHRPQGLFSGGEVTLFKAAQGNGATEDIPYQELYSDFVLGWGRRVEQEVNVVEVPGGHGSVLQEPNVAILAERFQDAIDSALEVAAMTGPTHDEGADQMIYAEVAE